MAKVRYAVQGSFVMTAVYLGYRHQLIGGGPQGAQPIDAYCPFGAVESMLTYFTTGQFLAKTASTDFWLLGALMAVVLVSGASFCGWLCPLGGLSEWLYRLRQRFMLKKWEVSPAANRLLSHGRFALLVFILYKTYILGRLWFEEYDPFKQVFHFNVETMTAGLVIAGFVVSSLCVERFWCRYLCPLGAIVGVVAKGSWFRIWRDQKRCIQCKQCERVCPTRLSVAAVSQVDDNRCIQCFRCVEACPVAETLTIGPRVVGLKYRLTPVRVGLIAVVVFWTVVGIVMFSGNWNPKNPQINTVLVAGQSQDIKGWMKWRDIMAIFPGVESSVAAELSLPTGFDREKTLKALSTEYGFDVEKVKELIEKHSH